MVIWHNVADCNNPTRDPEGKKAGGNPIRQRTESGSFPGGERGVEDKGAGTKNKMLPRIGSRPSVM